MIELYIVPALAGEAIDGVRVADLLQRLGHKHQGFLGHVDNAARGRPGRRRSLLPHRQPVVAVIRVLGAPCCTRGSTGSSVEALISSRNRAATSRSVWRRVVYSLGEGETRARRSLAAVTTALRSKSSPSSRLRTTRYCSGRIRWNSCFTAGASAA